MLCSSKPISGVSSLGTDLTLLLVVMLAGLWGAVFLPALLRARQTTSPIVSVSSFRHGMRVLGQRSSGRWIVQPTTAEDLELARASRILRRRRIFTFLVGSAAMTLVVGLLPGARWILTLHLIVDLILAGYVAFLVKNKPPARHTVPSESYEAEYLQAGHF